MSEVKYQNLQYPFKVSFSGPHLGGLGPRSSTNRGPPTKPFQFYFSLMVDTYETTTWLKCDYWTMETHRVRHWEPCVPDVIR